MKVIFFGTPDYVLPILEKIYKYHDVVAVVTQPPKPVGREQKLEYSAVDTWAHKKKIPIYFEFEDLPAADVGVLASYGKMIPSETMNNLPLGILVVHPSLLPKFRWGSPVPATIITGVNPTGVTIIKMNEKWDAGPILTQFKEEVLSNDTYETLRDRLFLKTADVLVELMPAYQLNKIALKPQDDSAATFARMIKKEDALIPLRYIVSALRGEQLNEEWQISFIKGYSTTPTPEVIERFIRAMTPWPNAWTLVDNKRLKILKAHLENDKLIIDEVQLEGKNPVSWKQFNSAYSIT